MSAARQKAAKEGKRRQGNPVAATRSRAHRGAWRTAHAAKNSRLGLATPARVLAPGLRRSKPANGIRKVASFTVKWLCADTSAQGGGGGSGPPTSVAEILSPEQFDGLLDATLDQGLRSYDAQNGQTALACGPKCAQLGMRILQHPVARKADQWLYQQAEKAGAAVVNLYRAVGNAELGSITKHGGFRNLPGLQGKYFSQTLEGAGQYARLAYPRLSGGSDLSIVRTSVSVDLVPRFQLIPVDRGVPAIVVPNWGLSSLTAPEVLNFIPLITVAR